VSRTLQQRHCLIQAHFSQQLGTHGIYKAYWMLLPWCNIHPSITATKIRNQEDTKHTKCATTWPLAPPPLLTSLSSVAAQDLSVRTATVSSNGASTRKTTGARAAKPTSNVATAVVVSKLTGLPVDENWCTKISWVFQYVICLLALRFQYAVTFINLFFTNSCLPFSLCLPLFCNCDRGWQFYWETFFHSTCRLACMIW